MIEQSNKNNQTEERTLTPIKNIKQLVNSYQVAKAIVTIRNSEKQKLSEQLQKKIPLPLIPEDSPYMKAFTDFSRVVNYNITFCCIAKIAIEDVYNYNFKDDKSITTISSEVSHLSDLSSYSKLSKVSLYNHTLNVFNIAIEKGKVKRRTLQIGIPILASLLHDFGKSSQLREELLGSVNGSRGSAYKPHPEVSKMYVAEILSKRLNKEFNLSPYETIETLEKLVEFHHTTLKNLLSDNGIVFVKDCDLIARKKELQQIKKNEDED